MAASSGSGGRALGIAGPFRPQLSRERLTVRVAGAGEREHPTALVPSYLRHQMSGGAEAVDAEPLRVARGSEGPVSNQAGTEQGRRLDVGDAGRKRETESLIRHRVLGVAAIHLVAGEAGPVAEVLPSRAAVHTCSAGPGQPGDAHAVAGPEPVGAGSGPNDRGHDLVAKYKREFGIGQLAVSHVQVGPADAAGPDLEQKLTGARVGLGEVSRAKWAPRPVQKHGSHQGRVRRYTVVDYPAI